MLIIVVNKPHFSKNIFPTKVWETLARERSTIGKKFLLNRINKKMQVDNSNSEKTFLKTDRRQSAKCKLKPIKIQPTDNSIQFNDKFTH